MTVAAGSRRLLAEHSRPAARPGPRELPYAPIRSRELVAAVVVRMHRNERTWLDRSPEGQVAAAGPVQRMLHSRRTTRTAVAAPATGYVVAVRMGSIGLAWTKNELLPLQACFGRQQMRIGFASPELLRVAVPYVLVRSAPMGQPGPKHWG